MGMPDTAPADLIVTRLDSAVSGLSAGSNLFVGPLLATEPGGSGVAAASVFVTSTGGDLDRSFGGAGLRRMLVQVLTRSGGRNGLGAAITLARQCLAALDGWRPGSGGYLDCLCLQPEPVQIGIDADGNHRLAFNVQLRWSDTNG